MPLMPLPAPPAGTGAGASAEAPPSLPSFTDFIGAEGGAAARFAERYRLDQGALNAGDDDDAADTDVSFAGGPRWPACAFHRGSTGSGLPNGALPGAVRSSVTCRSVRLVKSTGASCTAGGARL